MNLLLIKDQILQKIPKNSTSVYFFFIYKMFIFFGGGDYF